MVYKLLFKQTALCTASLLALSFAQVVHANPQGGNVVQGSAIIEQAGQRLNIHQHSNRAVINWNNFDIDVNEHTQFHQPSSSSVALNRVQSANPSQILGQLSANGNVILINPNGVFFGANSRVDVNSLITTTVDIDDQKFMDGYLQFNKPGNPNASITNAGLITAQEAGLVALVAPNVINSGVIQAKLGRVELASGDGFSVDLYGDGLFELKVSEGVAKQLVHNTGDIHAEGGTIAITAAAGQNIVNSLIAIEGELKAPTVEERDGKIIIAAAGHNAVENNIAENKNQKQGHSTVLVGGATLDAAGRDAGEQGGQIEITADRIALLDNTVVDASGHSAKNTNITVNGVETANLTASGATRTEDDFLAQGQRAGGSIKIGGDYLGTGNTPTAEYLYVDNGVNILNDAINIGDGGRTILWSDNVTEYFGTTYARGGTNGGHGGFLETSGKQYLNAKGFADLTAENGFNKGTYLLDPSDITIYGNVDPTFVSTDGTVDLASGNILWLDAADSSNLNRTAGTLQGTFNALSTVADRDVNRNAQAFFSANLTIPSSPAGTIYEQGGSGFGTWVGFLANGDLVFHAGRGNSFTASDAAHLVIPAGSAPTGTGTLAWNINVDSNTITAYWNDVIIGSDTANSGFSSWSGGDDGGFGRRISSVVNGSNAANFNGTINGDLEYYTGNPLVANSSVNQIFDKSAGNNNANVNGTASLIAGAVNNKDIVQIDNGSRLDIANTSDINDGHRDQFGKSFTFKTDGNVSNRQIIYKEGGGTNGYGAYVENGKLYVGLYNDSASNRTWREFDINPNTTYHLTSIFDATANNFTASLNGVVSSGVGLGNNVKLKSHTGSISFGATNGSFRDVNGNNISEADTVSGIAESFFYNDIEIDNVERVILEQYSSAKWDIGLLDDNAVTELNAATDANTGYSAFTAGYLERLSQAADIILQAGNSITLDLQGDSLALDNDRSIVLQTTNGNIQTASAGGIATNRLTNGGNITLNAGGVGNIQIDHALTLNAQNGGIVNLNAGGQVNIADTLNTQTENFNVTADDFNLTGTITGSGNFNYMQATAGSSLGVGAGGSPNITLSDKLLNDIRTAFSGYSFGRLDGGDVTNYTSSWDGAVTFLTNGHFTNEAVVNSNNKILARAGGNVVLNNSISTSKALNNAIVLAADNNFVNNVGANALQANNSRWLVYSNNPVNNTRNNLLPNASQFGVNYASNNPSTIAAGNHFLYNTTTRPTLIYQVGTGTVEYGEAFTATPTLNYVSGLISGDTLTNSGLTGAASPLTSYSAGNNVGAYNNVLTATDGTLSNALGYRYGFIAGDLNVTPAQLTVTADPATRVYGHADPVFTSQITGFKLTDTAANIDTLPTYTTTANVLSNAGGAYHITPTGAADNNYTFTYASGNLTITKAPLAVPLQNNAQTKFVGDADPVFSFIYNGFKNGDSEVDIDTLPTATSLADETSMLGEYDILIAGGLDNNYNLQFTNPAGILTIIDRPVNDLPNTVTVNSQRPLARNRLNNGVSQGVNVANNVSAGTSGSGGEGANSSGNTSIFLPQKHKKALQGLVDIHPTLIEMFDLGTRNYRNENDQVSTFNNEILN